jgi:hypothetical protein
MNNELQNAICRALQVVAVAGAIACSASTTDPSTTNNKPAGGEKAAVKNPETDAAAANGASTGGTVSPSSNDGGNGNGPTPARDGGSSTSGGSEAGNGKDAGTPSDTVKACLMKPDSCGQCCIAAYPDYFVPLARASDDCTCVNPGTCKVACAATWCAATSMPPDKKCSDCLDGPGNPGLACERVSDAACAKDATCAAWQTCFKACGTL